MAEALPQSSCHEYSEADNEAVEHLGPEGKTPRRFKGVLKSVGDIYGFIESAETFERFQRDVWVSRQVLDAAFYKKGIATSGVPVTFELGLNNEGQPNAKVVEVEAISPTRPAMAIGLEFMQTLMREFTAMQEKVTELEGMMALDQESTSQRIKDLEDAVSTQFSKLDSRVDTVHSELAAAEDSLLESIGFMVDGRSLESLESRLDERMKSLETKLEADGWRKDAIVSEKVSEPEVVPYKAIPSKKAPPGVRHAEHKASPAPAPGPPPRPVSPPAPAEQLSEAPAPPPAKKAPPTRPSAPAESSASTAEAEQEAPEPKAPTVKALPAKLQAALQSAAPAPLIAKLAPMLPTRPVPTAEESAAATEVAPSREPPSSDLPTKAAPSGELLVKAPPTHLQGLQDATQGATPNGALVVKAAPGSPPPVAKPPPAHLQPANGLQGATQGATPSGDLVVKAAPGSPPPVAKPPPAHLQQAVQTGRCVEESSAAPEVPPSREPPCSDLPTKAAPSGELLVKAPPTHLQGLQGTTQGAAPNGDLVVKAAPQSPPPVAKPPPAHLQQAVPTGRSVEESPGAPEVPPSREPPCREPPSSDPPTKAAPSGELLVKAPPTHLHGLQGATQGATPNGDLVVKAAPGSAPPVAKPPPAHLQQAVPTGGGVEEGSAPVLKVKAPPQMGSPPIAKPPPAHLLSTVQNAPAQCDESSQAPVAKPPPAHLLGMAPAAPDPVAKSEPVAVAGGIEAPAPVLKVKAAPLVAKPPPAHLQSVSPPREPVVWVPAGGMAEAVAPPLKVKAPPPKFAQLVT